MRTVLLLVVHFLTTLAKLVGPGGARAVVADSLLSINSSSPTNLGKGLLA